MTKNEILVKLSEGWQSLPEMEKAKYMNQFMSKRAEYDKLMSDIKDKVQHDPAFRQTLHGLEPGKKLKVLKSLVPVYQKELVEIELGFHRGAGRGRPSGGSFFLRKNRLSANDFFRKEFKGSIRQTLMQESTSPSTSPTTDAAPPSLTRGEHMKLLKDSIANMTKKWKAMDEKARKVYQDKADAFNAQMVTKKEECKDLLDNYSAITEEIKNLEIAGAAAAGKKSGRIKK